jgi:hypothetical protein
MKRVGNGKVGGVDERRQVRPRLTPEARAAWERILFEHGLTWSSMFEALGQEIAAGRWEPSPSVVRAARQLDWERKSRRAP